MSHPDSRRTETRSLYPLPEQIRSAHAPRTAARRDPESHSGLRENLQTVIQTWESNHRLLLQRIEIERRLASLRTRYLEWALDEIKMLREMLPESPDAAACRMYQAATHLVEKDFPHLDEHP